MSMTPPSPVARRAGPHRRRRALVPVIILAGVLAAAGHVNAQAPTGRIVGRVIEDETGSPLEGARVYIEGTVRGGVTDARGEFRIERIPVGERVLVIEYIGRRTERRAFSVRADDEVRLEVRLVGQPLVISEVVISTTREAESIQRTPVSVGVVSGEELRRSRPTHPSDIMGKVPGVWVNVTGGEGHMTAIRQPLTTDPVYLYLEDGVPTRSTGFFNHNALYEVNVPQAERIEVVKGPSSALYGSDAIGGVVNVETRPAIASRGFEATVEGGEHGWARILGTYAFTAGDHGVRADLNLTRTDGWRDGTAYDRQSATVRWDRALAGGSSLKTVLALSRIDQKTAGSSRLPEPAYRESPTRNLTPISFRDVAAARLSVAYERLGERSLLNVTPYVRANTMEILPNWSLTYDPAVWETGHRSLGVLVRYRQSFTRWDARLIAGVDVDWSPGEHAEWAIDPVREDGVFTEYTMGDRIYDYDVTFFGVSPYLHIEASPVERLRVTAGFRFDRLGYDYENRLGELQTGPHRRPASTRVHYAELSPKLGATFELGRGASLFAAYSQGFRAPSEGQLFRQGPALNTVDLLPVEATNYEAGLRGTVGTRLRYSVTGYTMTKTNDILTFQRADDNRETQNAGKTLHRGVELGLGGDLGRGLTLETAYSYGRHTYEAWRPDPATDYGGHEMESAPRTIGNTTLSWARGPDGARIAVEWVHLGRYWLNAENTERYAGHDLLGLTASWPVGRGVTVFGRVHNLTDERYAENAGWSRFTGREFAPGMPRTFYGGLQVAWGGGS